MKASLALALALSFVLAPLARVENGSFARAVSEAEKAIEAGDLPKAHYAVGRALERDPNSLVAWGLSERWADKAGDKDEQVYALNRELALARAQKKDKATLDALRARLQPLDPVYDKLAALRTSFMDKLTKQAETYEKGKRPHSAIRAYKVALALDPDRADIQASIERIAASPDPSLAEDARPRDLLEGISADWIRDFDAKHATWDERAKVEKRSYTTQTDAGYAVLVRASEAMEQMNAFYRIFFHAGEKPTPRIDLVIFKDRDEYLKLGSGPPVKWSAGQFTGASVETYIAGGFENTTETLFHEAAHQFVSMKTNAAGWLNEGMASFFEGTRILSNGTVIMNLPANGRLFPLASRMEKGWMSSAADGIDPKDTDKEPATAPSFRIVLEDQYEWGPPWYAPTWGVVFFLYNYQDKADGRFVYRKSFMDYVDASGGKQGQSAIKALEEVALANPEPVTPGMTSGAALPKTVDELNEVWKRYILDLRDRQIGAVKDPPPYLAWARNALKRNAQDDAVESFEKALNQSPTDVDVLSEFAELLSARKNDDRASKLMATALAVAENAQPVDKARLAALEERARKVDPSFQRLEDVRTALVTEVKKLIELYFQGGLTLQAMDLAYHLGSELQEPALFDLYERGVRAKGRSIATWRLAYNEDNLQGWNSTGLEANFVPAGETLNTKFLPFTSGVFDFKILTLDEVTSGDFSLECELEAVKDKVYFAGLVFGRKADIDCNALVLFPPTVDANGFLDLATFHSSGDPTTWRRTPVQHPDAAAPDKTRSSVFYKLRLDVIGRKVDVWVNDGFQATQEFPSTDVLRGTFGLITGRGEARFKNVRFLARHPRDPSAAIERKMTLEEKAAGGEAINGSWLGQKPPFPTVRRWLQGQRKEWDEGLGAPQLFVMWTIQQNDQIPIDGYLRDLADKHAGIGLRIVNLLDFWEEDQADAYLKSHPFPDSVAIDTPIADKKEKNFGVTFEKFDVTRFQLPRFLLLDIDGKVAWEGDPGFAKGEQFEGQESLLDVPLRELIAKRRLTEFAAWRKGWPAARAALARGDFEAAVPALKSALDFDATVSPEVAEAAACVAAVEGAANGFDEFAAKLAEDGREPALEVLVDWAEKLGKPVKRSKGAAAFLKGPNVAAWKRAPGLVKPVLAKIGKDDAAVAAALEKVAALPGAFPAQFAEEARASAGDAAALKSLLEDAAAFPAHWLAHEHFGW